MGFLCTLFHTIFRCLHVGLASMKNYLIFYLRLGVRVEIPSHFNEDYFSLIWPLSLINIVSCLQIVKRSVIINYQYFLTFIKL